MVINVVAGLLGAVDKGEEKGDEGVGLSGRSLSVAASSSSSLDWIKDDSEEMSAAAEEGLLVTAKGELGRIDGVSNMVSAEYSSSERVYMPVRVSRPSSSTFNALFGDISRVVGDGGHENVASRIAGDPDDFEKSRG